MLNIITPPTIEPVSLTEAKLQCVIDSAFTADDALLAVLISAARDYGESCTDRSWAPQTLEVVLDDFPDGVIELPNGPVTAVTSVKYIDNNGATQTMTVGTQYDVSIDSFMAGVSPVYGTIWPDTKQVPGAVRVRYSSGWTAALFPPALKMWMLVRIADLYAQRESFVVGARLIEFKNGFIDSLLDGYVVQCAP